MIDKTPPIDRKPKKPPIPARVLSWWFGLMAIGGLMFGALADKRPFGNDILAHPLVVFFVVVAAGLLVLRFVLGRPVPEVIPERSLLIGCLIALVAFLSGNWFAVQLAAVR